MDFPLTTRSRPFFPLISRIILRESYFPLHSEPLSDKASRTTQIARGGKNADQWSGDNIWQKSTTTICTDLSVDVDEGISNPGGWKI